MKPLRLLIMAACAVVLAGVCILFLRRYPTGTARALTDRKTVAERLNQHGPAVRERLLPYFGAVQVAYPPERLLLIGLKQERILEVWAAGANARLRLIRTYPILGASGRLGPKLREGDRQVPEGLYRIESLNPNSRFHLSLRLNYPNEFDREQARGDGRTNLGGDIMIHGSNVSIGCLAMGDRAAEDLFVLAARTGLDNISVILSPVDFRRAGMPEVSYPLPKWTDALYEQIRNRMKEVTNPAKSRGTSSYRGP